jgi:hypothetical protein
VPLKKLAGKKVKISWDIGMRISNAARIIYKIITSVVHLAPEVCCPTVSTAVKIFRYDLK